MGNIYLSFAGNTLIPIVLYVLCTHIEENISLQPGNKEHERPFWGQCGREGRGRVRGQLLLPAYLLEVLMSR